jgi:hypothetical protein
MSAFDKNEKTIHDAFSQITVDASKIEGKVKSRLHAETACAAMPRRVLWKNTAVAAIVLSAMLVVTVAAAALGGFDWFIQKFNPSFGEVVEPVEVYCEDQGIRMEVIGAQKYGNMAIVYMSLQDISGQNRLTEQTDFQDGFSVAMALPDKSKGQTDEEITSGFSWKQDLLFFDEESNTLYYEFNITADADSPLSDPLELGTFLIYFSKRDYENEPVSVSLAGLGEAQVTPIDEDQIFGGINMPDDWSGFTEALTPGRYAALTHGEDDQWISNIGIVDGKLHVQIGKIFGKEFGSTDATLALRTPDGQFIAPDYELAFLGDGNHRLLDTRTGDLDGAVYKYEESVFSVNIDELDGYTLCYTGSVYSGVEGRWRVAANLSDTSRQMRIWTNDVPVDGHLFEYLTFSPLGLEVLGSYEGEKCLAGEMSLALETTDGMIPMQGGGGSQNIGKHTFNASWNTENPLDVTTVTAVVINGTRIPVK